MMLNWVELYETKYLPMKKDLEEAPVEYHEFCRIRKVNIQIKLNLVITYLTNIYEETEAKLQKAQKSTEQ